MPVEFLTDEQAAAYGRYGCPARPLGRSWSCFFFLNDRDRQAAAA
jgi:hypothetical protein